MGRLGGKWVRRGRFVCSTKNVFPGHRCVGGLVRGKTVSRHSGSVGGFGQKRFAGHRCVGCCFGGKLFRVTPGRLAVSVKNGFRAIGVLGSVSGKNGFAPIRVDGRFRAKTVFGQPVCWGAGLVETRFRVRCGQITRSVKTRLSGNRCRMTVSA